MIWKVIQFWRVICVVKVLAWRIDSFSSFAIAVVCCALGSSDWLLLSDDYKSISTRSSSGQEAKVVRSWIGKCSILRAALGSKSWLNTIESRSDGFEIGYQKRWDHLLRECAERYVPSMRRRLRSRDLVSTQAIWKNENTNCIGGTMRW